MVGWHHQLDGHEFEQALGIGDRQGSLVCCSPWGHKESDLAAEEQQPGVQRRPATAQGQGLGTSLMVQW